MLFLLFSCCTCHTFLVETYKPYLDGQSFLYREPVILWEMQ
jgi:hypothetical protein